MSNHISASSHHFAEVYEAMGHNLLLLTRR